LKIENFILINLNQNISKARKAAYKGNRDKWIIFGLLCFIYVSIIVWFFSINSGYNNIIQAREETISGIKEETRKLKREIRKQLENRKGSNKGEENLKIDLLNLSKKDIELAYKIGEQTIPWSEKLIQLSEITPDDMCITKLEYSNNALSISAISKIKDKTQKDQKILNDFIASLEEHKDFGKEFVEYKMKQGKRISRSKDPYYEFKISAPLKKKIKNRLNEIEVNKEEIKEEIKEKIVEKKQYSSKIKKLAKSIDRPSPDKEKVKEFQIALKLFSDKDIEFGYLEPATILKRDEILGKKARTKYEKESRKINEELVSQSNKKRKRKYTKDVEDAAMKLMRNQSKSNPLEIERFQEAIGIANENDSNFGIWDKKTSKKYDEVIRYILKEK